MTTDEMLKDVDSKSKIKIFKKANENNDLNTKVEELNLLNTLPAMTPTPHKALPLNHLPDSLREVIEAVEAEVQCPVELAFQGVMSALSIAVSTNKDVSGFTGYGELPMTLMIMSSAISGDRKTSSDRLCHKGISKVAHELSKGEPLQWSGGDLTVEGTMKALGTSPVFAINNSDAASFFNSHSMQKDRLNQTISFLSDIWCGSPQSHIRSLGHRSVNEPRLSASLLTQEEYMREFLANERFRSQGLAARFIYLTTVSKQGTRMIDPDRDRGVLPGPIREFHGTTRRLFSEGVEAFRQERPRTIIEMSAEARYVLIDFYNDIEDQSGPSQKYRGNPWAQRAPEHANRLAGLFAAYRGDTTVSFEDAVSGCSLAKHFLDSYISLAAESRESKDLGKAYELLEVVRRKALNTVSDIARIKSFGKTGDVRRLLYLLENEGLIEWTRERPGKETHFKLLLEL